MWTSPGSVPSAMHTSKPAATERALITTTPFDITPSSLAPRRRRQCCACRSNLAPAAPSSSLRAPLLPGAVRAPLRPPARHTQSSHYVKNIVRVFHQFGVCARDSVGASICSHYVLFAPIPSQNAQLSTILQEERQTPSSASMAQEGGCTPWAASRGARSCRQAAGRSAAAAPWFALLLRPTARVLSPPLHSGLCKQASHWEARQRCEGCQCERGRQTLSTDPGIHSGALPSATSCCTSQPQTASGDWNPV